MRHPRLMRLRNSQIPERASRIFAETFQPQLNVSVAFGLNRQKLLMNREPVQVRPRFIKPASRKRQALRIRLRTEGHGCQPCARAETVLSDGAKPPHGGTPPQAAIALAAGDPHFYETGGVPCGNDRLVFRTTMKGDGHGRATIARYIPFDGARMVKARQGPDLTTRSQGRLLDLEHNLGTVIACHVVSLMHSISSER